MHSTRRNKISDRIYKFLGLLFKTSFLFSTFLTVIIVIYNLDVIRYAANSSASLIGSDSILVKLLFIILILFLVAFIMWIISFFHIHYLWIYVLIYLIDPSKHKSILNKIIYNISNDLEYNPVLQTLVRGGSVGIDGVSFGYSYTIMSLASLIYIILISYLLVKCLKNQKITFIENLINYGINKIKWWN